MFYLCWLFWRSLVVSLSVCAWGDLVQSRLVWLAMWAHSEPNASLLVLDGVNQGLVDCFVTQMLAFLSAET